MTKTLTMTKARETFRAVGDDVQFRQQSYVINRNGEPAFAIVPLQVLENWERHRANLLQVMSDVHVQNSDIDPDELMAEILLAQDAVRAEANGDDQ